MNGRKKSISTNEIDIFAFDVVNKLKALLGTFL